MVIHGPVTRGRIWLYTVLGREIRHGKNVPGPRNKTWQKRSWTEIRHGKTVLGRELISASATLS